MQGIFIGGQRPKSKKQIKDLVKDGKASTIRAEATSMFGNEYDGPITNMPEGEIYFVGPDPYTKRNFYGRITRKGDVIKVS